eukprot:Hpha_TRINITY_DN9871_c0_g2::TRINITY_DN9871_c0_g2_i1::g.81460::m.81460
MRAGSEWVPPRAYSNLADDDDSDEPIAPPGDGELFLPTPVAPPQPPPKPSQGPPLAGQLGVAATTLPRAGFPSSAGGGWKPPAASTPPSSAAVKDTPAPAPGGWVRAPPATSEAAVPPANRHEEPPAARSAAPGRWGARAPAAEPPSKDYANLEATAGGWDEEPPAAR